MENRFCDTLDKINLVGYKLKIYLGMVLSKVDKYAVLNLIIDYLKQKFSIFFCHIVINISVSLISLYICVLYI